MKFYSCLLALILTFAFSVLSAPVAQAPGPIAGMPGMPKIGGGAPHPNPGVPHPPAPAPAQARPQAPAPPASDGSVIPLPGPGETLFGYLDRLLKNLPFIGNLLPMLGVARPK
ncbi:hypothetical protein EC988_004421 [Linderina pennispora]|nr:hypothetical protein EC988_004421 [Linderina pennispora]